MRQKIDNDKADTQTWFNQFKFDEVYSDFSDFLHQTGQLLKSNELILKKIDQDLDRYGKEKKTQRNKDKQFIFEQTQPLDDFSQVDEELSVPKDNVTALETGRPRVAALLIYYFLFIRGYLGGSIRSKKAKNFIFESRSLARLLQDEQLRLPWLNALNENLNAISEQTLHYIWQRQLLYAKIHELEDYPQLFIDSAAVEANTAWPTDSKIMLRLLKSVYQVGQNLNLFGLTNFTKSHGESWLKKMKQLDFQIVLISGKAGSKRKRGKLYRKFFKVVDSMQANLRRQYEAIEKPSATLLPSQEARLAELLRAIEERLDDIKLQRNQAYKRIKYDTVAPASERKMSLNDPDCSYIAKGSRAAVIGYKPSLGRSGHGFVTSLLVPDYNAADSDQLLPATEQSIEHTGVVPDTVSVDDGYSSQKGRNGLKELGVSVVSINSSKGKKITALSDWEDPVYQKARADRSSVESLMFTLKFNYDFGRLGRLGHSAAKTEMLEKILAHNQVRTLERAAQVAEERLKEAA